MRIAQQAAGGEEEEEERNQTLELLEDGDFEFEDLLLAVDPFHLDGDELGRHHVPARVNLACVVRRTVRSGKTQDARRKRQRGKEEREGGREERLTEGALADFAQDLPPPLDEVARPRERRVDHHSRDGGQRQQQQQRKTAAATEDNTPNKK